MIQSKFKFRTVLIINICLVLMLLLTVALFLFSSGSPFLLMMFLIFICFLLTWLVWGEMRTKILKVIVENDRIVVTNFQGLGNSKVFYFPEIDGYTTIVLPSEYEDFEYLYVIKNGRKIIKISDFYHANYLELKKEISGKCKNLGIQKFSLVQEFKEIFST